MKAHTLLKDFNKVMETWKEILKHYSLEQLTRKEDREVWSLGQVFIHLIEDIIEYNFVQVEICLSTNRNQSKVKTPDGQKLFAQDSFPDARLKIPPSDPDPGQPRSLKEIREGLAGIEKGFYKWLEQSEVSRFRGKTKHPGYGWFNAREWLQFSVMHLRHHLRQKERIEKMLRRIKD